MRTSNGDIPAVHTIAIHPDTSSTIYVGSEGGGGAFKSINSGSTWSEINHGITTPFVSTLVIDPINPAIVYAGTLGYDSKGGIFKSSDNGQTWTTKNRGLTLPAYVHSIAIHPQNSNIVYAALSNNGIYKSTDGGENWGKVNSQNYRIERVLLIQPGTPTTIYLGTENMGFYVSNDGGTTFIQKNQGFNTKLNITSLWAVDASTIFAGTEKGGIYKSTNAGETWTYASTGVNSSYIQTLAGAANNPSILYAGTMGGVFKSVDKGEAWSEKNKGLPFTKAVDLLLVPGESETLYAGTEGSSVYRLVNGDWIFSGSGIANTWIRSLAYDPQTPTNLYAGTFQGHIFKSTDGGMNWVNSSTGLASNGGITGEIVANPVNPSIVYAAHVSGKYAQGVYKSTDSGDYWTKMTTGMPLYYENVTTLAIDPDNPDTLYAGIFGQGLYKTTNGGQSWNFKNIGENIKYLHEVAVDPALPLNVYAGAEGRLFKSSDGGEIWAETNLSWTVTCMVFDPVRPGTIYAGTEGKGVYRSEDYGLTWKPMTTDGFAYGEHFIYDLVLDPNAEKLYAAVYTNADNDIQSTSGVFSFHLSLKKQFLPMLIR